MVQWTKEQQKVIDLRNRNILVSAAAGSGKTAVLVERIINMISEKTSSCNIDELLVVTFTKAAASEMRERIGDAIAAKLVQNPEDTNLQRQQSLLHNAQIMTIDSFCLTVIRNYFHYIDLDPSFRIADDAELTLLKSDVISEILEEEYEEGKEDFLTFVECYANSRTDDVIEEFVLKLYEFSMSYPWPEEWLKEAFEVFELEDLEDLEKTPWMKELLAYLKFIITDACCINERALALCAKEDGPFMYEEALRADSDLLYNFIGLSTYQEYAEAFLNLSFQTLSRKRSENVKEEKRNQVKALRDNVKSLLSDIKKKFFFQQPEEMLKDLLQVKAPIQVLIKLTIEFAERFAKKKEEKNILDFGDMEHFALKILVEKKDGIVSPTLAAIELSEQYKEILIDEYQDSNLVQETILNSISKERINQPNIFMVGDVKQSIYKFRLARPELFMQKYDSYSIQDSLYQKIDLHKNFRSRAEVLFSINDIFERIMQRGFGGIEYDEAAALNYGASFLSLQEIKEIRKKEQIKIQEQEEIQGQIETQGQEEIKKQIEIQEKNDYKTEIILVTEDKKEEKTESSNLQEELPRDVKTLLELDMADEAEFNKRELEARVVAKRIKEMIKKDDELFITAKTGVRAVEYRDIVILLRTMAGWSETFVEVLAAEGIPAYAETQTGYFKTLEIQTMLNMLRILDNPRQDIPFAAILYSPIAGLESREIAEIRIHGRKMLLYEAVKKYETEGKYQEIKDKLNKFLTLFHELRNDASHLCVHALIRRIFDLTQYNYYVLAMPGGEQRKRNLDMLLKRAISFEATSYHGLFQFVRYIERLIKYDVDYGEAGNLSEQDNAVRIMSIHKSKGLEFPVVFLAGMGKKFNQSDTRTKLVLHSEYGIGPECIDYKLRTKTPTLMKRVLQQKSILENLSEELRILYVGMTRAKEKLVMTGYVKKLEEIKEKWNNIEKTEQGRLLFHTLSSATCYFDFVGPAAISLLGIRWLEVKSSELVFDEIKEQWKEEGLLKRLLLPENIAKEDQLQQEIKMILSYQYPYEKEAELPVKTTVSELKRIGMIQEEEAVPFEIEEETKANLSELSEFVPTVPEFLSEEIKTKGTQIGTWYHRFTEEVDLSKLPQHTKDLKKEYFTFVKLELDRLVLEGRLEEEAAKKLNKKRLVEFCTSDLVSRMAAARKKGLLKREQPFVFGLPAHEVNKEYEGDAILLIQGIIDTYFEEEDGLILVDYKTDWIPDGEDEKFLIRRYHTQLDQYVRALEQMTGKKVKEKLIYSFYLSKEIHL